MTTETLPPTGPEITQNDKLLAALAYIFPPLVSLLILLMDEYKNRPFPCYHAWNAIGFAVAIFLYEIVATVIFTCGSIVTIGIGAACLWVLFFLPWILAIYYAYQAYQGKYFEIQVITQMMRQQGWMPKQ